MNTEIKKLNGHKSNFSLLPIMRSEKDIRSLARNGDDTYLGEQIELFQLDRDQNENELVLSGDFLCYYTVEGKTEISFSKRTYSLEERDLLLVSGGSPHSYKMDKDATTMCIKVPYSLMKRNFTKIVEFRGAAATFVENSLWGVEQSMAIQFRKTNTPYLVSLIDMLVSEQCFATNHSKSKKDLLMLSMLAYLCDCTPTESLQSQIKITRNEQVPKILNYIIDNYKTVTLDNLAEFFHYTVPYVSKLIRTSTGVTFTEILLEIKYGICCSLLQNSDFKINAISEIAGFRSTDHFNRVFKKKSGMTPGEYRKSHMQNAIDNV